MVKHRDTEIRPRSEFLVLPFTSCAFLDKFLDLSKIPSLHGDTVLTSEGCNGDHVSA